MFGNLGVPELLLIFLVVLLVFGAKRIPEIARGLGKGIKEFKSATREIQNELNIDDQPRIQQPRAPQQAPQPRETPQAAPKQTASDEEQAEARAQ